MQLKQNIKEELQAMGINLPNNSNLAVPDNYFESLTDKILDKALSQDFIAGLPKEMPYVAPDNYFNNFEVKVPVSKKTNYWKPVAIAASIALVIGIGWNSVINNTAKAPKYELLAYTKLNVDSMVNAIDDTLIAEYVANNIEDFASLNNNLEVDEPTKDTFTPNKNAIQDINASDAAEYLQTENLDELL